MLQRSHRYLPAVGNISLARIGWSRGRSPEASAKLVGTEPPALPCIECGAEPSEAVQRDFFGGKGKVVSIVALPAAGRA
jgi:hypothetical protein